MQKLLGKCGIHGEYFSATISVNYNDVHQLEPRVTVSVPIPQGAIGELMDDVILGAED